MVHADVLLYVILSAMHIRRKFLAIGALLAFSAGFSQAWAAKPDFSGTWKLDASKSEFGPMPVPDKCGFGITPLQSIPRTSWLEPECCPTSMRVLHRLTFLEWKRPGLSMRSQKA